jgi:arabinofuranan 3-O-arabinosyltransferase
VGAAIVAAASAAAFVVFAAWFRTGRYYAHGDLTPFVRTSLSHEIGAQWTHQNTAAGGPTYEVVRWVELAFIDLAHLLGGTSALAQRMFFAALFAFAASGVAAFVARLSRRPMLIFVGGVIGAFNPLVMVNLPNFLIALLIGLMGWTAALTIDAARAQRKPRPRVFALVLLGAAYLALNPPLLAMFLVWLALLPVVATVLTATGRTGAKRVFRYLLVAAAWAVPIALWWIVPYLFAIRSAAVSGTIDANTDVFAWSWTQVHSTFDRVLTLVAKWNWPDPNFGWSASTLARPEWLWMSFALPLSTLLAPLVCRPKRRRTALWLATIMFGFAFIAKGLNPPLRGVNAFIYRAIPGTFLLREPMSKVGGLIAMCAVAAWILTIDGLIARARVLRWRRSTYTGAAMAAAGVLLLSPLVFAWPMITGAVVQSRERVAIPAAWRQVASIVDDGKLPGKAIVLPLDDFYQVPTTWGYYGSDIVPTQLITRPTIARHPQAYIGDPAGFEALRDAAENGLVGRDSAAAAGALRALGVSYVVVRKDIDHSSPIRSVDMPQASEITNGLHALSGAHLVGKTSVADVYEFTGADQPVEALSGTIAAPHADAGVLAVLSSTAPKGTAIVTRNPRHAPLVRGVSWSVDVNRGQTIDPPEAGDWIYQRHANGTPAVELRSDPRGLVLHDPVSVRVGNVMVKNRPDLLIPGSGRAVAASVDGRLADLATTNAYVRIKTGSQVTTYSANSANNLGPWSPIRDCNQYDSKPANISVDQIVTPDGQLAWRLRAAHHSACITAHLLNVQGGDIVRVALEQRGVRGARPRTCVWQPKPQQCASLAWSAQPNGDWYDLSAVYRVPKNAGRLSMLLYADQPAKGSGAWSENWYRNISVNTLVAGATTTVAADALPSGALHLGGAPAKVSTSFDAASPLVGTRSEAFDCNRKGSITTQRAGIRALTSRTDDPTAVTLTARHDTGCVSMPVFGLQRSLDYELSVDTRVIAGGTPRVCLWEAPAGNCAQLQTIASPTATGGRLIVRGRAGDDATNWRLFLYADAGSGGATIEYRHVRLRLIADESLILRQANVAAARAPKLTWHEDGPDRYRVHVENARAPFVLTLTDAFSRDWHVNGLPAGATAKHIEVDGYRNGWVVNAQGDLDLTVAYGPARYGRDARNISEIALVLLLVTAFAPVARFLRRWRRQARQRAIRTGPRRVVLPDAGLGGDRRPPAISL